LSIRQVAKVSGRVFLILGAIFFVIDHGLAVRSHVAGIRHLDTGDLIKECIEIVVWACILVVWSYTLFKPLSQRHSSEEGTSRSERVEL
jgi:hypothetical protein